MVNKMKNFVERIAEVLRVLGDTTRLRIIRLLASNKENRFCVLDIARRIGISQPAVSQHLRILKHLNLLEHERNGYRVYYSINIEVMKNFRKDFDELFRKAFIKCDKDVSCEDCSEREKCK